MVVSFSSLAILVSVSVESLRDCGHGSNSERDWSVGCRSFVMVEKE